MASFVGFVKRVSTSLNPPTLPKSNSPPASPPSPSTLYTSFPITTKPTIKFGILGAAAIGPWALIQPARSHPEVVVYAVAARDFERAQNYAKKHGIEKAYEGYEQLLNDEEVDAIYNPLPNGLHYEWTMKALAAGKHVLVEKPSASTAEETEKMFEFAEKKGLVLMEALHYRFHPAIQRVKEILDSRELGNINNVETIFTVTQGIVPHGDIRYDYALGGGALPDVGCYTLSCILYLTSSSPTSVLSTTHTLYEPPSPPPDYPRNIDRAASAKLLLTTGATATMTCDLSDPHTFGIIPKMPRVNVLVECEHGSIEISNFVIPTFYHSITVKPTGMKARVEKVYKFSPNSKARVKGEDWWTSYRFQLEAFVDGVRGREPQTWVGKEDSVNILEWIEKIYEKNGLGSRPKSSYEMADFKQNGSQ